MKKRLLKKIGIIILTILILGIGGEIIWSYFQIRHHKGSNIEVIEPQPFVSKYSTLGIKNINIFYSDSNHFKLKNIVLKNGTIETITDVDSLQPTIEYINGTDKYLIPGLIDTHVHLQDSKNDLYLYLVNGVTTIFEMYGTDEHIQWKKEAEAGSISPDLYVASRKIGSREGLVPLIENWTGGHINVTSEAEVKKMIRNHKEAGFDALKLSSYLNLEMYRAILEEAKKQQIPVVGHLSYEIGLKNLYGSGQTQIAHVEELIKSSMNDYEGYVYDDPDGYIKYLKSTADTIAVKLMKNNIAVSTTIWLMESLPKQKFNLEDFIKTIPLEYANSGIAEGSDLYKGWLPGNNEYEDKELNENSEKFNKSVKFWETYVRAIHIMTKSLYKNGVRIMVGTDANVPCTVPGFSLHDEMRSLSEIGITNEDVLKAATQIPAEFMKSKTGKIQQGYRANLVLLSGNPLENIDNTKKIEMVFFNNYRIDRNQIEKIKKAIVVANNNKRRVDINQYLDQSNTLPTIVGGL
ncbi:amidohydrolase family protein [Fulvivirgaceae bacterium BMA10]|uniref:Amidohydrolase family protein n=1 Tax=Splendidivirga corallicola TaxID=3051826 RepID=A0ABT8KQ12_9BACT|nr:amidohydrolase family protein [Fulvivirgaceae bacterium BMA10]